jgi:UDP-N-acetyl-D-glucosamine/UDP-N-acetyl-D-galactosamine dehydrogenase
VNELSPILATAKASPPALEDVRVGIVGLGYVGLPLAVYMAQQFPVMGFDVNKVRASELAQARDRTGGVTDEEFAAVRDLTFTAETEALRDCNFYIVTVPTPIDEAKRPDLTALMRASETVGSVLSPADVVVYESTVYPGATEEVCVPILAKASGLTFNRDFFVGYSPERINPGDLQHRLPSIVKVTSGSTPEAADLVDKVYGSVVTAGTHKVSSVRVAEAAKVIENIQRDVNIALVNELAMLFKDLGLDTREVLAAAGTKWNFHAYRPGLVGGHCIGVDPYYLTHKAQSIGFHPEMILAGRRINDGMAAFVARDIIKAMLRRKLKMDDAKVLVMGFTFKENIPDTRNTKVAQLVRELGSFLDVAVFDPIADREAASQEYGVSIASELPNERFQAIVLAVRHRAIMAMGRAALGQLLAPGGLIYDVTGVLPAGESDAGI